ncbi:ankyrin repeat and MYND domain-containing protein 1-like isoform X5 [Leptidea sinapis]|uniref:ankyrin repeat and MYND domain-containing protein 1-like isoform X5 n=1 Tax=Leptidea sinapis TaxID=189913 RepID=UPI0021C37A1D|nr:ankyrin repeat and MYND domain-containing protein 1-like isoform X5 [Leptidea sinapis]
MTTVVKLRGVNRTNTKKSWPYDQYYTGERDAKYRKNGSGENNWSGAKSLETYRGCFTRNSMHGRGEYRWRIRGEAGVDHTYEGYFYNNTMHGYGLMSFPDGKTFRGLFCNNIRFGPGVQSDAKMNNDVGLWRGAQLVRLAWSPVSPSVIPDFMATPLGRNFVEAMRTLLTASERLIGETNSAIDLLKKYGADPKMAVDKWNKLYPKNCTDHNSPLCPVEFFEFNYYNKIYKILETNTHLNSKNIQDIFENLETPETERYYAWNNSNEMINMFTHSFQHEYQRDSDEVDIYPILSGARHHFRRPGVDEINSRTLLLTSYLGYTSNVAELVNSNKACANVMDSQGNSPLMYATSGDQVNVIRFLVEAGANVDNFNDSCCTALGVALIRYMCAYKDISNNIILQTFLPPPEVPITR